MQLESSTALITGGASGLGLATATLLAREGARVVIVDLPGSAGADVARSLGGVFVPADITDPGQVAEAVAVAASGPPLRAMVHCAGRGGALRILDKEGAPGSLELFEMIVRVNLVGTFNVLRHAAAAMAGNNEIDGERGAVVLTASAAAFEGQIGQAPYAASKAGVHGLTIVAARDLATKGIRVCTIAPGLFDTPMLARLPEEARQRLAASVPNPRRLGDPAAYAAMALALLTNPYVNGETVRLDGALRMAPR